MRRAFIIVLAAVSAAVSAALGAAGCTVSQEPYEVDAIAELVPVGAPAVRITGPIEVLGTGAPASDVDFERTVAAYHVQLPDGFAPWFRLYTATSCAQEPVPMLYEHLGTLRRVGDEVHFFVPDIRLGDRTVDIDVQTVTAGVSPHAGPSDVFGLIAVVQAPGDGSEGTIESPMGQLPAGGSWLACGSFVAP